MPISVRIPFLNFGKLQGESVNAYGAKAREAFIALSLGGFLPLSPFGKSSSFSNPVAIRNAYTLSPPINAVILRSY